MPLPEPRRQPAPTREGRGGEQKRHTAGNDEGSSRPSIAAIAVFVSSLERRDYGRRPKPVLKGLQFPTYPVCTAAARESGEFARGTCRYPRARGFPRFVYGHSRLLRILNGMHRPPCLCPLGFMLAAAGTGTRAFFWSSGSSLAKHPHMTWTHDYGKALEQMAGSATGRRVWMHATPGFTITLQASALCRRKNRIEHARCASFNRYFLLNPP